MRKALQRPDRLIRALRASLAALETGVGLVGSFLKDRSLPPARNWLDLDVVLPLFGRGRKVAVARYLRFLGERDAEPYEDLGTYAQAIEGDEAFA